MAPFHAGAVARLHILRDQRGDRFAVVLARQPVAAVPASLLRRGVVSACLTHDEGTTWPDRAGENLAAAVLEAGGAVMLSFATLVDAIAFKTRVDYDNQQAGAPGGAA
jgi:hypothetical protein